MLLDRKLFLVLLVLSAALLGGCRSESSTSSCERCHQGLEPASATHTSCVECHAGDPESDDKERSHREMRGGDNPASPQAWEQGCGRCHPYHLGRIKSNLMYTNTGMIKNIQATWEGEDGQLYATQPGVVNDRNGRALTLNDVRELDNLSGELYRKFCSLCHLGEKSTRSWQGSHSSGCAACHFPYNENGTYQGGDGTMQGKWPHSANHTLQALPETTVCFRCHNRSGRIALSYQGLNDGNNGMVPTRDKEPGPMLISGARNVTRIAPDIHFAKGMECIDCHTSRDVMGDGYAYENMYLQTEVRCEDCHGSARTSPRFAPIERENDEVLRESKGYSRPMHQGEQMALTAKERKYANVFSEGGKVWVQGKRSGKLHESKVITGTPEHTIVGHERMECYTCHSRTVVQCYGCHTEYDRSKKGMDFITGSETPGRFGESEDYRMLYPFPLALNQNGRISPVTPGCQTFVTVKNRRGEVVRDEYVATFKGKNQLRFAPFYSHNSGSRAIGCSECHGNPAFLGFGQHVVEEGTIEATLLCEKSAGKPLDGFLTMTYGKVRAFSAITRDASRPLNAHEVKRALTVNLCLPCHDSPKDPIYRKELDDRALDRCLNRPAAKRP